MSNINISEETQTALMKDILLNDFVNLFNDIVALEKLDNLRDFELEDLSYNYKIFESYQPILEYYCGFNWKDYISNKDLLNRINCI